MTAAASAQECVQDVFDVLDTMITHPYDDQPFADFVTRYGTDSPAYVAYQNSFTAFYTDATDNGIAWARLRLTAQVARDCAAG